MHSDQLTLTGMYINSIEINECSNVQAFGIAKELLAMIYMWIPADLWHCTANNTKLKIRDKNMSKSLIYLKVHAKN